MTHLPHIILETANFHGGDVEQIKQAIKGFAPLTEDYHSMAIKFHAFKPENVMMEDFSWYPVIKDFFITPEQWAELIDLCGDNGFQVWLDLFCVYGVEILEKNLFYVKGVNSNHLSWITWKSPLPLKSSICRIKN